MKKPFSTIPEALEDIKKGKMLIILDSDREEEADFFIPSELITPKHIMTMIRFGGGLVCVAITQEQAYKLQLPLMISPESNTESTKLNLTLSVNARNNITTGISAFDRALTIKTMINPDATNKDITIPGHIFGIIAKPEGLLERKGHTEAAVDLAKLTGFLPSGVLCEIVGNDGKMAKLPELIKIAEELNMKIILLNDLIDYLKQNSLPKSEKPKSIVKISSSMLPTKYGIFTISIYRSLSDNREHAVLSMGRFKGQTVLTRIHSQCVTGDTLSSLRCDCGEQLHESMKRIQEEGKGIILYLNQEGRGIGLSNKIKAYALQDKGFDTVEANHELGFPADTRDYKIAAEILKNFDVSEILLMTNNPDKVKQISQYGLTVKKRIPIEIKSNEYNEKYLQVKKQKLGHKLKNL